MTKPWFINDDDYDRDDFEDWEEELWNDLSPDEFCFAFQSDPDGLGLTVVVCPEEYWKKEKCWFDGHMQMESVCDDWPDYLFEAMEAVFEIDLSGSDEEKQSKVRKDLEELGLKYEPKLTTNID